MQYSSTLKCSPKYHRNAPKKQLHFSINVIMVTNANP